MAASPWTACRPDLPGTAAGGTLANQRGPDHLREMQAVTAAAVALLDLGPATEAVRDDDRLVGCLS